MKAKILSLLCLCFVLTGCGLRAARNEQGQSFGKPGNAYDKPFQIGTLLYYDDFTQQSKNWVAETVSGSCITISNGILDINVPGGCTLWFTPELIGPVMIEYEAVVIKAGGPNDRGSDLNCFWMATDPAHPDNILDSSRGGHFGKYDNLRLYYVGYGGNDNSTTRFRRYRGDGTRPLLAQNDLREKQYLIEYNTQIKIQLIAINGFVQYYRNGELLFEMNDPEPLTRGWFGLRTVRNHMHISKYRVYQLSPMMKK